MRKILRKILRKIGFLEHGQSLYLNFIDFKKKIAIKFFLPFFASNGFLSSLYYTFFSNAFYNSHKSILKGKINHFRKIYNNEENEYLLANYIHAIEKGLTMKDRKEIYALSYIKKTVSAYEKVITETCSISPERIKWFYDILNNYFKECGEHKIIKEAKEHFYSLPKYDHEINTSFVPFKRADSVKSNITYDDFYKLTQQRRSVRWFKNKPIPRELIDKALHASILSPSACNRQPFRFLIYDDKEWLLKLNSIPSGTKGFGFNIPVLAIVVGMTEAYESERDKNVFYIDSSLATMSFMLALETLGLGSCALNWPDSKKREKTLRSILDLETTDRIVMFIAIGFPDENEYVGSSAKKSLTNIRYYNQKK